MSEGIYKRCGCRDSETGKQLGAKCPELRRKDGAWNPRHGTWCLDIEVVLSKVGKRERIRASGLATDTEAKTTRREIERLLAIPSPGRGGDAERAEIVKLVRRCLKAKEPLPDHDDLVRKYKTGQPMDGELTVGAWLDEWFPTKQGLKKTTRHTYATHIRLYLKPYLGDTPLSKLRVSDVMRMFAGIDEENARMAKDRTSGVPSGVGAGRGAGRSGR